MRPPFVNRQKVFLKAAGAAFHCQVSIPLLTSFHQQGQAKPAGYIDAPYSNMRNQVRALTRQVARRPLTRRIGIRLRQHPSPEQQGNLVRVQLVVLRLTAMHGLHV